jgi:hypothetical protein
MNEIIDYIKKRKLELQELQFETNDLHFQILYETKIDELDSILYRYDSMPETQPKARSKK